MKKKMKNLPDMNKQELYRLARELELPGRSRLSRDGLIQAIRAARRRKKPAPTEETVVRKVIPRTPVPKPVSRRKRPKLRAPKQVRKPVRRRSAKTKAASVPPPSSAAPDPGLSLPMEYGRDVLVAMVRDPRCVYCYWELSGDAKEALRRAHGQDVLERSRWVLRVHDLAAGTHQEVTIHPDALGWYLDLEADRAWRIEIGVVTLDGRFLRLAVGDTVHTPPSGIGLYTEGAWAVPAGEGTRAPARHVSSSDLLAGRPLSEPRTPRE